MYEKIKAFCEENKISIAQFERICDLGNGYILKLPSIKSPSLKKAKRIAEVMGIPLEELLDE